MNDPQMWTTEWELTVGTRGRLEPEVGWVEEGKRENIGATVIE